MRSLLFLFALAFVLIAFAVISASKHVVPPAAPEPAPDVRRLLLSDIAPGMSSDSVELLAGAPALIVDGIPEVRRGEHGGLPARTIDEKNRGRYESWYYRSARIDTISAPSRVILFDPENNEYPQRHRTAYLEYSLTVVFDKATERVTKVTYLPRGFLDHDGDVEDGAVIG